MRVLTRRDRLRSGGPVTLRLNLGFESYLVGVPRTHSRQTTAMEAADHMRLCIIVVRNVVSLSRTAER